MRLFLSDSESVDEATSVALQNIQTAFQTDGFVESVGSGLMKIDFLLNDSDPDAVPAEGDAGQDVTKDADAASQGMGTALRSLLYVAGGSAAMIVFVGSVLVWRRRRGGQKQDGMITQFAGSSFTTCGGGPNATLDSIPRPASPLSQMISTGSYKLGDNSSFDNGIDNGIDYGTTSILNNNNNNMSPVYEIEDESVMVSESGYTTEAGRTDGGDSTSGTDATTAYGGMVNAKYSTIQQATPEMLGALPRPGMTVGDVDMEAPSDSELDTSCETLTPVKMRFMVDQGQADKMLDTAVDVESPSSTREDDALLFEDDKEEVKEEADKEEVNETSPSHSDVYTVEGTFALSRDVDLQEEP